MHVHDVLLLVMPGNITWLCALFAMVDNLRSYTNLTDYGYNVKENMKAEMVANFRKAMIYFEFVPAYSYVTVILLQCVVKFSDKKEN